MLNADARQMRKNPTDAERRLWKHLRLGQVNGCKFRRQAPIGDYIVDFACFEKHLVIEVDGGQHAGQVAYDAARTAWLESRGYKVLQFRDNEVLNETDAVMEKIYESVTERDDPHLTPPPWKGEERIKSDISSTAGAVSQAEHLRITVNGEQQTLTQAVSVLAYLEANSLVLPFMAVARNGEVLLKSEYGAVLLADGDVLEIVRMVGGG